MFETSLYPAFPPKLEPGLHAAVSPLLLKATVLAACLVLLSWWPVLVLLSWQSVRPLVVLQEAIWTLQLDHSFSGWDPSSSAPHPNTGEQVLLCRRPSVLSPRWRWSTQGRGLLLSSPAAP